jgi:DNA-binding NarL/FixJ family response regulator
MATEIATKKNSNSRNLTRKEIEVLQLVMQGMTQKQMAEKLFNSPRTIETHIANLFSKFDLNTLQRSTINLYRKAIEEGYHYDNRIYSVYSNHFLGN